MIIDEGGGEVKQNIKPELEIDADGKHCGEKCKHKLDVRMFYVCGIWPVKTLDCDVEDLKCRPWRCAECLESTGEK